MAISQKYGKKRWGQIQMIMLNLSLLRSKKRPLTDPGELDPDECREEKGKHCPYCHKKIILHAFKKHKERCEEQFKQDFLFAQWLTAK